MMRLRSVLSVLVGLGLTATACGQAPAAPKWPERVPVGDDGSAKGVIREMEAPGGLAPGRVNLRPRVDEADRADAAALLGGVDPVEWEGPGAFIYNVVEEGPGGRGPRPALKAEPPPPEYFVFVSGARADADAPVRVQRTWFAYLAPKVEPGAARGLALLMPGMFGTPEPALDEFASRLRAQGWGVVRMMSQPSRFTERVVFEVDLAEPVESVSKIASEMNDRVAEAAFAAEAAMGYIAAAHPEIPPVRVAVGMSGGGMILPTVVAREAEKYAAAVIIAGGANFFAMSDESNYKYIINAVDFRWLPGPPTDEQRAQAYEVYLRNAPMDSFNTAARIAGKPMLLIHGVHDGAVPAKLGDLLWEQLGKPERWVQEAGHEEVFIKLAGQMDRIMEWIDVATLPAKQPAAGP